MRRAEAAPAGTAGPGPLGTLILAVNGPGELNALARPLAAQLRRDLPAVRIALVLWPGLFASGTEDREARAAGLFDQVIPPGRFASLVAGRRRGGLLTPSAVGKAPTHPRLVLHLGKQPLFSLWLGRRLGCEAWVYAEFARGLFGRFDRTLCTTREVADALPAGCRREVVGQLLVDAVQGLGRTAPPGGPVLALFPGSRMGFVTHLLPVYMALVERLRGDHPGWTPAIVQSPFLSDCQLDLAAAGADDRHLPTRVSRLRVGAAGKFLETADGLKVPVLSREQALGTAEAAVTLPGTATAELAALAIPHVLILPHHRPDLVPGAGLLKHLGRVPGLGPALRDALVAAAARRIGPMAHANLRGGESIVTEVVGCFSFEELRAPVARLLADEPYRAQLRHRLRGIMGSGGAARAICRQIAVHLGTMIKAEKGRQAFDKA